MGQERPVEFLREVSAGMKKGKFYTLEQLAKGLGRTKGKGFGFFATLATAAAGDAAARSAPRLLPEDALALFPTFFPTLGGLAIGALKPGPLLVDATMFPRSKPPPSMNVTFFPGTVTRVSTGSTLN